MNLKQWIYPIITIACQYYVLASSTWKQAPIPPEFIFAVAFILPIFGIASAILNRKRLNAVNFVFLLIVYVLLLGLFALVAVSLLFMVWVTNQAGSGIILRFLLAAGTGILLVITYILASMRVRCKNRPIPDAGNEPGPLDTVTHPASEKTRKKIPVVLIPMLLLLLPVVVFLFGASRLAVGMNRNNIDLGADDYQMGQELLAYQKTIRRGTIWLDVNRFTTDVSSYQEKPLFTATITGVNELGNDEKSEFGFAPDSRVAVIDFDFTILTNDYIWETTLYRVRDADGNWLDTKNIGEFSGFAIHTPIHKRIAFELDDSADSVTFFLYARDWKSSDDDTAKFILPIV